MTRNKISKWFLCTIVFCSLGCSENDPEPTSPSWENEPIVEVPCEAPPVISPAKTTVHVIPDADDFPVETLALLDPEDSVTNGVIVEDLDGDGFMDIATVADRTQGLGSKMIFFWGDESGSFETKTELDFPSDYRAFSGCVAADIESDGDLDIFVGTFEGDVVVLRASAPRQYELILDAVEYPPDASWEWVVLLIHLDLDQKGPKDLIVGTHGLLSGTGQGHCVGVASDPGGSADVQMAPPTVLVPPQLHCLVGTDDGKFVPAPEGVCPPHVDAQMIGAPWSARMADLNHDRRPDIVVAADFTDNIVLYSMPDGGYTQNTPWAGISLYDHAMGIAINDFDLDGYPDLYITDVGPDQLWNGTGCGRFTDASITSHVAEGTSRGKGWGVAGADFDHDGDVDLFVSNSSVVGEHGWEDHILCGKNSSYPQQAHFLLVNDGTGTFTQVGLPHVNPNASEDDLPGQGPEARRLIVVGSGDLDGDGDVDIVTTRNKMLQIYWNETEKQGHWIAIRPVDSKGVPFSGARVQVMRGEFMQSTDVYGGYGTDGHSALTAHFGLGDYDGKIDIRIQWPDGSDTEMKDVDMDQTLTVMHSDGGA